MPIDYDKTQAYITGLVKHGDPILSRMEDEAKKDHFPIIGPAAGAFCYLMARSIGAKKVFELGSGYGYSTYWFCKAVKENGGGEVHHTVWDEKLHTRAKANLSEGGFGSFTKFHLGEAVAALNATPGSFDIIFNDIDKEMYPGSIPAIKEKLRVGGLILIDNMLAGGNVYDPEKSNKSTDGIREFTRLINADPDFVITLIPIRDGVIAALRVQ